MKIMDESMESEDCAVTATLPPKKKKLKQARLPFQNLASPASQNALSNKKRKQMSSSPTTHRSPKIVKITTKENTEQKTVIEAKSDDKSPTDKNEDAESNSMEVSETSSEKLADDSIADDPPAKDKKTEGKGQDKPGAITRFLQKRSPKGKKADATETKADTTETKADTEETKADTEETKADTKETKAENKEINKDRPIVLLTRCDNSDSDKSDPKSDVDEKPGISKEDESSNEELARALEDSDAENDGASKDKSDVSSDNADSDSERGISSSDDETDEQKRSTDAENGEKSVNGKGLKTPTSGVKAEGALAARRKLTPKQLEKKMNSSKRREEREKLKQEKEKKREEERLIRRKEKEARRREKKEKEEAEKELKKKEKEQKELKKQMEIEQRQKEKERKDRAKEEDRRKREEAKEEEKRKKEEDKLEAERKKQKAASTFVSFFVPKKAESKAVEEEKIVLASNFMPFEVKADMRVAPICRRSLDDDEKNKFDEVCVDKAKETDDLYVTELKKNRRKIRKSGKTWPPESKDDDIIIMEEDDVSSNMVDQTNTAVEKQRAKLLAFAENRRPPYWGTWTKRSSAVTPRRPFSKDTKWFDYEVDSDEEWEEEEPGESLRGSDDEKDEENPDDDEYDVDNEFMVPHGYLSDEEAQADEDEEDMSPETQKLKLKILGAEFEEERKTQTSRIKPRVIGPIWQSRDNSYPENIPQKLVDFLIARQAWVRETPIVLAPPETSSTNASENGTLKSNSGAGENKRGPKATKVPTEALPELIRLIHGNPHGLGFLIKEFMTFWNRKNRGNDRPLKKSSLLQKIRELAKRMACPEEGSMHLKACWYVSEATRKEYLGDELLTLPNSWSYALTPRRKTLVEAPEVIEKPEKEEKEKKSVPLITQYTMKITQEEMKKQLTVKPAQSSSPKPSTSQSKPAKRATLISVGRGEQFPKSPIINAFSRATSTGAAASKTEPPIVDLEAKTPTKPMVIDLEDENCV